MSLQKGSVDNVDKIFDKDVIYTIEINENNLEILKNNNIGNIEIIKEIEVEK